MGKSLHVTRGSDELTIHPDHGQSSPCKKVPLFHSDQRSSNHGHKHQPLDRLPARRQVISARTPTDSHAGASDLSTSVRERQPKKKPQQLPLAIPLPMALLKTMATHHIRERRTAERNQHVPQQHMDGTL